MATYTDNFNRANGALGGNWSELSWSDQTTSIISNEAARSQDGASGNSYHRWNGGGTWGREQYSEVTVLGTAADRGGPCVYMSDAGGCYYLRLKTDNGAYQFSKIPNTGGDGTLLDNDAIGSFTTGDTVGLKAEDDGSGNTLLTLYHNGSSVATYTDTSSPITSGDPGFCLEQFWRVTLDAWEGDDFAVAAADTVTAIVTDASGTALSNETGIDWAWTDTFAGNPTDTGTGEETDASGEIVVDVPNTSLSSGQFGYLRVRLSNGDVGIAKEAID